MSPEIASDCTCGIGKALRFREALGFAGMEMQHAMIQSPDPQVRLIAGERCNINGIECGMKNGDLLTVINQHAALLGSKQKMARKGAARWQ